jgi:hypothetical protein
MFMYSKHPYKFDISFRHPLHFGGFIGTYTSKQIDYRLVFIVSVMHVCIGRHS